VWKPFLFLLVIELLGCAHPPKPAPQDPSPMVDFTRAHERLQKGTIEGLQFTVGRTEVLVTPRAAAVGEADLLIHFHGASWLPFHASVSTGRPLVVAAVNIGQGGGAYDQAFRDPAVLDALLDGIRAKAGVRVQRLYLSGFSAGYGAIRAILRNGAERIDGILLLDGLHTGYIPERKPVAEGGKLDTVPLQPFLDYARAATAGRKRFVFAHSEIFPGTFASTTETADYLIRELGLKRTPVVRWGPRGMQQLSEVRSGGLIILGFAGNSAPDHVDQFHSMPEFLQLLFEGGPP
jgi:hypothetical protein